ncbi:MliC family protein [Flavobacterium sp. NG2]|uniref:MliC family protein n=1 Tax=Flavobacterium sp. NG2 TaxID=3097547 RepID=UPI002A7F5576|nr:MliC family protein [Flavobacterium sp. NG2]WPR70574.1 MliC family protein [Flavobacterium sp. NG2]
MRLPFITTILLTTLSLTSCKETAKTENEDSITETVEKNTDNIVTNTATDKDGKKLEMSFNITKDIAVLHFEGETIELVGQKPASGIWYKNDTYELRGKGQEITLTKDGQTVFKN